MSSLIIYTFDFITEEKTPCIMASESISLLEGLELFAVLVGIHSSG